MGDGARPDWTGAKPTFAGSVAALWLTYVHDLITLVSDNAGLGLDNTKSGEMWVNLCDRIERVLMHLESSSMPLPHMSLEDVIELGAEMAADEEKEKSEEFWSDLDEQVEQHQEAVAEVPRRIKEKRNRHICPACNSSFVSKTHRECPAFQGRRSADANKCPRCTFTYQSQSHQERCAEIEAELAAKGEPHIHRWKIGEPDGPTSAGICEGCGATKDFKNSGEYGAAKWRAVGGPRVLGSV